MPKFQLRQDVEQAIRDTVKNDLPMLQEQLGIDHSIPGCPVVNLDPYGVGVGVTPRYIQVALRGEYYYDAWYRGGIPGLAVGDELTIKYISEGKRYEVEGPSGATGATAVDIHTHADNTEGGQNLHQILELEFDDPTELTINAGVVTRTQVYHTIDTEGDAATDNLDTINGGVTGDVLVIKPENDARTVVVKHNTGNIWLLDGTDVDLDHVDDHLMLIYDGSYWCSFYGNPKLCVFAVAGGAITIIPNAMGDVIAILTAMYAVSESAGGTSGGTATVTPGGSVNLYNDGVDVLALAVGAGGDVTLQRTAGAATFDVSLNMVWI